jgi:hypothetical protein
VTVTRHADTGAILLVGSCPVDDAEPLLQMLQATPAAAVDWTQCGQIHTAVYQVLLAAGAIPVEPCGDGWLGQWLAHNRRSVGSSERNN